MRIVVSDDHVIFAESLAHLLAAKGAEVVAVTHHPLATADVLRRERVDVCVLDVMYGGQTIFGFLADLRKIAPGTGMLLLTGLADEALVASARTSGAGGVARKTQPAGEILAIMSRVAAGETVFPQAEIRRGARQLDHPQRLASYLTARERQVLGALVSGTSTTKLARGLGITEVTARCHIQNVLTKLGVHSRLEAAALAIRSGLIDPRNGQWLGST